MNQVEKIGPAAPAVGFPVESLSFMSFQSSPVVCQIAAL